MACKEGEVQAASIPGSRWGTVWVVYLKGGHPTMQDRWHSWMSILYEKINYWSWPIWAKKHAFTQRHTETIYIYYMIWLVVEPPLWKIWVRQLGWWHSQYIESQKNLVPNHQPVTITNKWQFPMEFSINVWLSGYPKSHSLLCLTIVLRKACQPIFLNKQMRQYTSHHKCQSLLLGVRHQGFTGEIPTDNG